ncbi:hypothetical protein D3C71_2019860 [compost metagenome]
MGDVVAHDQHTDYLAIGHSLRDDPDMTGNKTIVRTTPSQFVFLGLTAAQHLQQFCFIEEYLRRFGSVAGFLAK